MEKLVKASIKSPRFFGNVDVIVPFHGQYNQVVKLVSSILFHTRSNPYQICLVDDASPNTDIVKKIEKSIPKFNGFLPQLITVRNKERLGFGGSLLQGYRATSQPWIVFLHSDCLIEDGQWLASMGLSLLNLFSQKVGMVGARTNFPGNGGDQRLKVEKMKRNFGDDIILSDTYLPLYCVMCHRDLFNHIGGFIKCYPYTGYEDQELFYRMKKYGYKQAISYNSWVRHEGSATINALCKKNGRVKREVEKNYHLCLQDIKKLGA